MIEKAVLATLYATTHLAVLTGAGMSAESGIATFRDAQTGLWERYDPQRLASPRGYEEDKALVWGWYEWRRMHALKAQPHAGHLALAALAKRFEQFTLITQNVDDLHERAGNNDVIHLHGSLHKPRCSYCANPYRFSTEIPEEPEGGRRVEPPLCKICGNSIRPGVVWFGESLPEKALKQAAQEAAKCEVFISVGTSALVWPAAGLSDIAKQHGAKVIQINPDETPLDSKADFNMKGKAGDVLPMLLDALKSQAT